jgi:hypothetical protein
MLLEAPVLTQDLVTLASLVLLCAACWVVGSAVRPMSPAAERMLAGILCLIAVAWVGMIQPIIGVSLIEHAEALSIVLVPLLGLLGWRYRASLLPRSIEYWPLAVAVAAGIVVAFPSWRSPSGQSPVADMTWHQGWIRQLAAGIDQPGAIYRDVPNSYPWLYHSLGALLMQGLPGGMNTTLALIEAIGLLVLGLGIWLLARELGLDVAEGTWSVFLSIGAGGLGWLWIHHPDAVVVLTPQHVSERHGDFIVVNALTPAMGNVTPLLPRELGLAFLPAAIWLALRGLNRRSRPMMVLAGVAVGFAFLIGPLAGAVGAAAVAALGIVRRRRLVLFAVPPAALVAAMWLGPLVYHYHELGGFISLTSKPPFNPSITQTLVAFGVVVPLAVTGFALLRRSAAVVDRRSLVVLVGVPALICLASGALARVDSSPLGAPALVRTLRYLPYLDLLLVLPAGIAAARLTASRNAFGVAVAAVIAFAAIASPGLAAMKVNRLVSVKVATSEIRCDKPLPLGPYDTVAVTGQHDKFVDALGAELFLETGASSLYRTHPRIRFRDIFSQIPSQEQRRRWEHSISQGGDPPDWVDWVVTPAKAVAASKAGDISCRFRGTELIFQPV